ncbi:MAG TPA: HAMP domain-containing sensor histidine kinase [Anaerolineales bacterium]|nr:HAMP domain-containing sensor histidine kinase [Anaerolineales bacterium]
MTLVILLSPIGLLVYLRFQPEADLVYNEPLFHFYIVTFTTFASAVISILLTVALGESAQPRHLLAATAFAVIGSIFFSHGIATPNALIDYFHPAVSWSAWMTLLGSGVLFALAGLDGPNGMPGWLPVRRIILATIAFVVVYLGIAAFAHEILDKLGERATPWHQLTIFIITLLAWMFAFVRFTMLWRINRNRVDGTLAFVSLWLVFATVSMHRFTTWHYSWWMYHFLLLISFMATVWVLIREYEQTRKFRLMRYYMAVSLIFTALLALLASGFFATYSYNALAERTTGESRSNIETITQVIAAGLSPGLPETDGLHEYTYRLKDQAMGDFLFIFDADGKIYYPYGDAYSESKTVPPDAVDGYTRALNGEIVVQILPPGEAPDGYEPSEGGHTVIVFAPLWGNGDPSPLGVVQTIRATPELTEAILRARATGLIIATIMMGLFFFALLLVVRRADRILTNRSNELQTAYSGLRRAESLRDDMTNMIVHDLRNPLSAISASLDILQKNHQGNGNETENRFTTMAQNASRKMMKLVDDILTVSKFESGELRLQVAATPVAPLIQNSLDVFQSQVEEDRKEIGFFCQNDLSAMMDGALISRVLDNLISNALKYTDEETGIIEIVAQNEQEKVYFRVRDNGEGIPDDYKSLIFDKFKQVPNNSTSQRKGTGLGLTFCQMVVEAHGGKIWVEDATGGGSEFVFWIPRGGGETGNQGTQSRQGKQSR